MQGVSGCSEHLLGQLQDTGVLGKVCFQAALMGSCIQGHHCFSLGSYERREPRPQPRTQAFMIPNDVAAQEACAPSRKEHSGQGGALPSLRFRPFT